MRKMTAIVVLSLPLFGITMPLSAATGLETFVMATNGQSNYSTYGQPDPSWQNFAMGDSVPANASSDSSYLALDGVSGFWRDQAATALAPLSDAASSSGAGVSGFGAWSYSGSTSTTAAYGQLKSQSQATHTGNSDNMTVNNAQSYSIFTESLNPASPSITPGTAGTMLLTLSFDGALSVSGTGIAGMVLRYDYGTPRPGYPALNRTLLETFADIYGNGYQIYGPHSYLGSFTTPAGFSLNVGPLNPQGQPASISFGGSTTVEAAIPVTFGSPNEFRVGLETWVGVGNGNGKMNSNFGSTATVTGIQLFTSGGTEITDFSLTSGSGTLYTAAGLVVPEPASLLTLAPLLAASFLRRRKTKSGA